MAYEKQTWTAGDAITQQRMMHIENGIEAAAHDADQNTTNVSAAQTRANEAYNLANTANGTANTNANSIGQIQSTINLINQQSEHGDQALAAITAATTGANPAYDTLAARFDSITATLGLSLDEDNRPTIPTYTVNNTVASAITGVDTIAKNARSRVEVVEGILGSAKGSYENLPARLNSMSSAINTQSDSINEVREMYDDARGSYPTIEERFAATENEVSTARGSYGSLNARLVEDENNIANNRTNITELSTSKISTSAIVNDWTDASTNKVISAARANELKQILGGFSTDSDNTVAARLDQTQTAAQTTAKNYTDSLLGAGFTSTNTVAKAISDLDTSTDGRLDAIEEEIAAAHRDLGVDENEEAIADSLNKRFSDSEGDIALMQEELTNARTSTVVRTVVPPAQEGDEATDTDTEYASLDARLEAIESHAAAARTDVDTIARELAMNQNGAIVDTNTKIDALESDVQALASEIQMGQDENGRLIGAETRLDTIDNDLNAETTGIKVRLTTAESSISTLNSNVSNLTTELGTVRDKANNAATQTQLSNAIDTINTNLSNNSTTIVLTSNDVNFDEDGVTPTTLKNDVAIVDNNDYIIENPTDNKYYYWKHISNAWHLMGGAGSGTGGGSSSGAFAASLDSITEPDINTDYFVGNNTDGYLHYRYINESGTNTLKPVIIGLHDYYQLDTREVNENNDTVTYLDLYKFDETRTQASLDYDTDKNNIISTIKLPKGGGAVSNERIYVKIPAGQSQYISYKDLQDNGLSLGFSYTCYSVTNGDYEYESAVYTLTTESGEIIKQSSNPISPLTREAYNTGTINISFNREDNLAQYCTKNNMTKFILTLSVPDRKDIIPRTLTVMITPVELSLTSTFSDQRTYTNTDDLIIPYTFTGISGENINFEILFGNGNIEENITASSVINSQASRITIRNSILANKVGIYNLRIRASQLISGTELYSNTLAYQIGLIELNYDNVLLFSGASIEEQVTEQYRTLHLPYYLYLPSSIESAIVSYDVKQVIYDDQNVIVREDTVPALIHPADTLTTGAHSYSLRISSMIAETEYYKVTITCEDTSLVFNIRVNIASQQINIETQGLIFDFKPEQFSNNASTLEEKLWSYESNGIKYSMRIPENAHFDWRTGGWIEDDNHVPCFCIKAGSRVEFIQQNIGQDNISPLTLFWNGMESTGSDFKCVFKIDNVKTPDAPFLTSLDTIENTIINYGKLILSSKQDIEDDSTLLHSYLNTRYLYTKTINNKGKVVKESIGTTVLNDGINEVYGRFGSQLTEAKRAAAETKAAKKNSDKIKDYIGNIYTIANYARTLEHKEALLNILSGNSIGTTIDYTTIKDSILSYLQNVTNATAVYNILTTLENDTSSIIYDYRQEEPENLDAILNGFIVEGKEGKDGIIAMLEFTFETIIKNGGTFTSQVISTEEGWPRTNTFTGTATFLVTVEDKKYEVTMKEENGDYTEIVSIQDASNETQTAYGLELNALGSNIYLPSGRVSYAHSEGDTIEFEYNINGPLEQKINSSIIIYEDGVPSAAKLYTTGNAILEQQAPGKLTIGSDDCDVYIYKMRLYDRALTDKQILNNFYADGLTVDDMIARYNRNKNLITNNIDELTPQLVAQECPDLRVIMIEAPNLTGGKTSFIKNTKIRCIYKNGRPEDNWVALNAYHAGQGTSSDNYGASARNLDIIFGFDGKDTVIVPKPQKNNYQFDPNYKSILIKGLDKDTTNDIKEAQEYEAEGYSVYYNTGENEPGTVSLTENSVPNNWFNIKVNVASSENTNNAFLQKRFNRYLEQHVYKTPAQKRDYRIKNDMEFFNCAIFIKETGTPKEFLNDNGEERHWHFYGLGNIGDSKKTDKTRVNIPNDPYEFAVEITDNGLLLSGFSSGVFYISENSKLKSQTNNMDIAEALSMTKSHVCTSEEYTVNNGTYTFSISSPDTETMYFISENNGAYYRRFIYLNNVWTEAGEPISFARTSYGIKYPISKAEWECSLNEYHEALYNFGGKGWDKSFEFRYDITTKDGETVARSDLEEALNELHQSTNKKAFANMYSYIVTTPNMNFVSQLNNWFIENSLPYWYLFTERYTMIDSRAKNTFYHYGKIYITEDEASGAAITALNEIKNSHLAEYIANNNIQAHKTATAEQIANAELDYQISTATFLHENAEYFEINNAQAAINNGYRFELWGYDMDTALGINNNGQMVFSAGVEDTDKDASGWIYNEAESVIWRRVRENMYAQLAALYINLKADCFNAENLINEFDQLQAQFPEELWRADFERKYYRPFRDLNETTYLNDMANGRKKYQRRQFERNMAIYINSKYQRNGSYLENDLISFRPQFTWTEGRDTRIIIKPYSTMYINFALGNYDNTTDNVSGAQSIFKRVERGEEFIINTSDYIHDYNNIQCIIYNASRLMYLDGLGNFECKQFILGAAKKLSVLKLGSSVYTNRSMNDITNLGLSTGLPLLEELDLTNIEFGTTVNNTWISNPPQTFALENFPLLKKLNAEGCNIRSFTFKDGGMLEHITFPAGLTAIQFKNLYKLVDTYENEILVPAVVLTGTAGLIDYYSTNSYSSSYNIVQNMINNSINKIIQLYLDDINWTINNIADLEPLATLQNRLNNKMYLKGIITITGTWSEVERDNYMTIWPQVTFDTSAGTKKNKYKVTYKHDDGTILKELYIDEGSAAPDIYSNGLLTTIPTKPQTERESYRFGSVNEVSGKYVQYSGWHLSTSTQPISSTGTPYVFSNIQIITYFVPIPRTYQIRWYLDKNPDDRLVKTSPGLVSYGGGYDQEAPTVQDVHNANFETCLVEFNGAYVSYKIFNGWEKLPTNINPTANDTYYAIHANWITANNVSINSLFEDTTTLTPEQLLVLSAMDSTMKDAYHIGDKIDTSGVNRLVCTMGSDNNVEGTEIISTPYRLDQDNEPRTTSIQPLRSGNDAFTLAIDYCFNEELTESITTNYSTLVSCYYSNISAGVKNGFSLFYGKSGNKISGPRVGFGDVYNSANQSVLVGSEAALNMRNIVVLRHPANEPILYVYSGISGTALPSEVIINTINWQNYNSDAYLNIGQLGNDVDSTDGAIRQVSNGKGTIYWMKYWPEDLGQGECKKLASWPHEQITYGISYLSNDATTTARAIGNTATGSIHLASLNTLSHGTYYQGRTQESGLSWGNSELETIMNKRIMNGLPIKLQSILCKDTTSYTIGERQDGSQGSITYALSSSGGVTRDYVRPYSLAHVLYKDAVYKNAEESPDTAPFPWLDLDNIMIYDYGSNGWSLNTKPDVKVIYYLNMRFPNKAITWGEGADRMRIFREVNSGTVVPSSTIVADSIYQATNILKSGDVYIMKRGEVEYTFIYATTQEVLALGLQPTSTSFDSRLGAPTLTENRGLWIRAEQYWTRSVIINSGFNFGYIHEQGTPNTNITNSVDSRGLKFSQILII